MTNPLFWQAMGNTMWFVVFGVPLVVIASLAAALLVNAKTLQLARGVARRLVRAVRDDVGGDRGGVELSAPHALRADQLCAGRARHRAGRLARQSQDRAARDPAVRGVEELRLQHDHLPRRAAGGVARSRRRRARRRRGGVDALSPRHLAGDRADRAAGRDPDRRGHVPIVRRTLCHDPGRTGAIDRHRALFHVRGGVQMVEPRVGIGGRLHPVPVHPRRDASCS